jgi:hypothetical protein
MEREYDWGKWRKAVVTYWIRNDSWLRTAKCSGSVGGLRSESLDRHLPDTTQECWPHIGSLNEAMRGEGKVRHQFSAMMTIFAWGSNETMNKLQSGLVVFKVENKIKDLKSRKNYLRSKGCSANGPPAQTRRLYTWQHIVQQSSLKNVLGMKSVSAIFWHTWYLLLEIGLIEPCWDMRK